MLRLLYATTCAAGLGLLTLGIMTPLLLREVDGIQAQWERDFAGVKVGRVIITGHVPPQKNTDDLWADLVKMWGTLRTPRDRLRRQYEDFAPSSYQPASQHYGGGGYESPPSGYETPETPIYGYGLARLKCEWPGEGERLLRLLRHEEHQLRGRAPQSARVLQVSHREEGAARTDGRGGRAGPRRSARLRGRGLPQQRAGGAVGCQVSPYVSPHPF